MLTLALETATRIGSVALLQGEEILDESILDTTLKHSEKILPALTALLQKNKLGLEQLDLVACGLGPGSFTGLRVALGLAKGFAFALKKPLIGVSSLQALAMNAKASTSPIVPLIDAHRGEVYAACYQDKKEIEMHRAVAPEIFATFLGERFSQQKIFLVGDGAERYQEVFQRTLKSCAAFVPDSVIHAGAIGRIAFQRKSQGFCEDPASVEPFYIRAGVGGPAVSVVERLTNQAFSKHSPHS